LKKQIVIFTVLISNIVFSVALSADVKEENRTKEVSTQCSQYNVSNEVNKYLSNKGLDPQVVQQRFHKYLKHNVYANSLMINNILTQLNELSYEDVIAHISNTVLFQKSVDLSSYNDLIALVQRKNFIIHNSLLLKKVEKIARENQNICNIRYYHT